MHDFLLAKEIVDEILKIVDDRQLSSVVSVKIEIGQIALAHDGHAEHVEDISIDNLKFGIVGIAKKTLLKDTKFNIIKTTGKNWQIVEMEAE